MATLTKACEACQRSPMKRCLSHTTLPFGQYGPSLFGRLNGKWGRYPARTAGLEEPTSPKPGQTFDEVPLGYLDWLSGQSYVNYGWLRDRLTQYLTRPVIVRELEEIFPDVEDDSRQPAFSPIGNPKSYRNRDVIRYFVTAADVIGSLSCPDGQGCTAEFQLGQVLEREQSLPLTKFVGTQRREPMPKPEEAETQVLYGRMTPQECWDVVAEALLELEAATTEEDFQEFHRVRKMHRLSRALETMYGNFYARAKLRAAYREAKARTAGVVAPKRVPAAEYVGPPIRYIFHCKRYSKDCASAWYTRDKRNPVEDALRAAQ